MTFKQTLSLTTLALSVCTSVAMAAALPANVKSVQATIGGEEMTVLWTPVPGAFSYRVYYSHESILGNGGNYDDSIETPDSQTMYVFPSVPLTSDTIYVGVLAVDKEGNESEGFEVEASVQVPALASSSSSSVAPVTSSSQSNTSSAPTMPTGENPTSTAEPMGIKSVAPISETGVLVTFSKDVDARGVQGEIFLITTLSGTMLQAVKMEVNGADILLTTEVMPPDTEYILGLISTVPAVDGTNATPTEPQVHFTTQAKSSSSTPSENYGRNPNIPGPPGNTPTGNQTHVPTDPAHLGLSAVLRNDGTYNVIARWSPSPDAATYSLYTSKNYGPYAWNSAVEQSKTSVQYSGVMPGTFGVKVASVRANVESPGIEKVITLPASGIGILGIAAVAGAGAARRMQRRKKKVV